jgi:hypothetical protein
MDNKDKTIEQVEFNYGDAMNFEVLNGAQIQRKIITDTYFTADESEEETMVKDLSKMIDYLFTKREGFCGYLSWCYALMTLCYLLGEYDKAISMLDNISVCSEDIKRYIFTGNYNNADGSATGYKNFSYGESSDESVNTLKFAKDSYQTAALIHKKSQSFESGFSYIVTSILYHLVESDNTNASKDCENLDSIVAQLREFLIEEKSKQKKDFSQEFCSVEKISEST